jgi:hypothetical protein
MSAVMVSMVVLIRTFSSVYTRTLSLETVHTTFEWNCQMVSFPKFGAELLLDNYTLTIILNNPVFVLLL